MKVPTEQPMATNEVELRTLADRMADAAEYYDRSWTVGNDVCSCKSCADWRAVMAQVSAYRAACAVQSAHEATP